MWNNKLFVTLLIHLLLGLQVMGLKPRDAISAESVERYDTFMAEVMDTSFLSLEHDNDNVKVYEHDSADDSIIRSGTFGASSLAASFFEQEEAMAIEQGLIDDGSNADGSSNTTELEKRVNSCLAIDAAQATGVAERSLDKRVSRCYQFCGTIANCRGNNGCPHCYAVRQGCLWQKWCR